eukprot:SAG11_NODE_1190_length_5572_cov_5.594555_2_plen_169_part_00
MNLTDGSWISANNASFNASQDTGGLNCPYGTEYINETSGEHFCHDAIYYHRSTGCHCRNAACRLPPHRRTGIALWHHLVIAPPNVAFSDWLSLVGFQFLVDLPPGSTIDDAYVVFEVDDVFNNLLEVVCIQTHTGRNCPKTHSLFLDRNSTLQTQPTLSWATHHSHPR